MQTTRSVWKTERAGDLGRMTLEEEVMPSLDASAIRVRVKSVGLNFADVFALAGLYSATPEGPFVPGLEFAGIVEATGTAVTDFRCGDSIMGLTRFGGYASMIDIDPAYCRPLPAGWTFDEGAAFPVQTLTAWYGLKLLGDVKPGQTVLVHSAAGGVGLQALALCRKLGVTVLGTVGNTEKKAFLYARGFESIVVRDREFPASLKAMLGDRPLHVVLDALGGHVQRQSFKLLAPTGRLVVFGAAEFAPGPSRPRYLKMVWQWLRRPRYDPLELISANISVMGFNLIWLWEKTDLLAALSDDIRHLGLPPPYVGRVFPFSEAPAAVQWLRCGRSVGKVTLAL